MISRARPPDEAGFFFSSYSVPPLAAPTTEPPVPYKVLKFQETPNPNAVKCVLDRSPGQSPRSFFNAASAAEDPLGKALFEIPGVTNVLINDGWITVNKEPQRAWPGVKDAIERTLDQAS